MAGFVVQLGTSRAGRAVCLPSVGLKQACVPCTLHAMQGVKGCLFALLKTLPHKDHSLQAPWLNPTQPRAPFVPQAAANALAVWNAVVNSANTLDYMQRAMLVSERVCDPHAAGTRRLPGLLWLAEPASSEQPVCGHSVHSQATATAAHRLQTCPPPPSRQCPAASTF